MKAGHMNGKVRDSHGRSSKIRTCDPRLPKTVLYQAELYSEPEGGLILKPSGHGNQPARAFMHIGNVHELQQGVASVSDAGYLARPPGVKRPCWGVAKR